MLLIISANHSVGLKDGSGVDPEMSFVPRTGLAEYFLRTVK